MFKGLFLRRLLAVRLLYARRFLGLNVFVNVDFLEMLILHLLKQVFVENGVKFLCSLTAPVVRIVICRIVLKHTYTDLRFRVFVVRGDARYASLILIKGCPLLQFIRHFDFHCLGLCRVLIPMLYLNGMYLVRLYLLNLAFFLFLTDCLLCLCLKVLRLKIQHIHLSLLQGIHFLRSLSKIS